MTSNEGSITTLEGLPSYQATDAVAVVLVGYARDSRGPGTSAPG